MKTQIEIEKLLQWAYRDELSKKQTSAAEGIWDRIQEHQQHGGIDKGYGAAQRYSHFGLPDPDAERIELAVAALEDVVIDWKQSFDTIAGDLSGLISVNEMTRSAAAPKQPKVGWGEAGEKALKAFFGAKGEQQWRDRPRDVLMVGGIRTNVLITMHAIKGTRPDWRENPPYPEMVPAVKGPNAMIVGECKGKNLYSTGSHCPLKWSPSPLSIISSRAEYAAWHQGIVWLSERLLLSGFDVLPPACSATPWLENTEETSKVVPVMPTARNHIGAWGTLPLAPKRDRMGPPVRQNRPCPVRYPLVDEPVEGFSPAA